MEEISKKFDIHLSAFSANNMDPPVMALSNKMRERAIEWEKGSSILKCTAGYQAWHFVSLMQLKQTSTYL
jgi:hypothetical protein